MTWSTVLSLRRAAADAGCRVTREIAMSDKEHHWLSSYSGQTGVCPQPDHPVGLLWCFDLTYQDPYAGGVAGS